MTRRGYSLWVSLIPARPTKMLHPHAGDIITASAEESWRALAAPESTLRSPSLENRSRSGAGYAEPAFP
jgi:hypothetical protein